VGLVRVNVWLGMVPPVFCPEDWKLNKKFFMDSMMLWSKRGIGTLIFMTLNPRLLDLLKPCLLFKPYRDLL